MVRAAASTAEAAEGRLTEPSFGAVFRAGVSNFARESFLPLGAFYAGLRLSGLTAGIVAAAVASVVVYLYERRSGRDALLVRLSLGFVVVQSVVGLLANSTTVYLAQPVVLAIAWGAVFLGSAAIGRPLAGALASAWYSFPPEFRRSEPFKRVFGVVSLVWGAYFVARGALRLAILLHGSLESFFAITFVTGTPVMVVLLAWSIRYSIRKLSV
jgi:intracellular septation protein A